MCGGSINKRTRQGNRSAFIRTGREIEVTEINIRRNIRNGDIKLGGTSGKRAIDDLNGDSIATRGVVDILEIKGASRGQRKRHRTVAVAIVNGSSPRL